VVVQLLDKRKNFPFRPSVQCRKWLIHQQNLRLREQRAADADALTLASRQIAWRTVKQRANSLKIDDFVEML
jgi:hypothetical protein